MGKLAKSQKLKIQNCGHTKICGSYITTCISKIFILPLRVYFMLIHITSIHKIFFLYYSPFDNNDKGVKNYFTSKIQYCKARRLATQSAKLISRLSIYFSHDFFTTSKTLSSAHRPKDAISHALRFA